MLCKENTADAPLGLILSYHTQASKSCVTLILLNNFPIPSRKRADSILNTYQGIKSSQGK